MKFGDVELEDNIQIGEYGIQGSSELKLFSKASQRVARCYDVKHFIWTLVSLDDSINTYRKLKDLVASKIRQSPEDFTISEVAGKRFTQAIYMDDTHAFDAKSLGKNGEIDLKYILHTSYKDVAFCLSPSGYMTPDLLKLLETKTIYELRTQQQDGVVKSSDDEVLLTLVGLKILEHNYTDKAEVWGLIGQKVRRCCQERLALSDEALTVLLEGVTTCFKKVYLD